MATSSGNSSSQIQNSGSEGDLQVLMVDERKRKRMQSNRESARRSRMRKQKHLDELIGQVAQLKKENSQILSSINVTSQQYANVEAENSVLRAQMMELSQRLNSLNDILSYINNNSTNVVNNNNNSNNNNNNNNGVMFETTHHHEYQQQFEDPWNFMYLNQPIMASADMLYQY